MLALSHCSSSLVVYYYLKFSSLSRVTVRKLLVKSTEENNRRVPFCVFFGRLKARNKLETFFINHVRQSWHQLFGWACFWAISPGLCTLLKSSQMTIWLFSLAICRTVVCVASYSVHKFSPEPEKTIFFLPKYYTLEREKL